MKQTGHCTAENKNSTGSSNGKSISSSSSSKN